MTEPAVRVAHATKLYRRRYGGRNRSAGSLKSALVASLAGRGADVGGSDGSVPALVDVTFDVPAGETVGVVGPNGSGKSTLLKLLAGILRPTSGEIEVRGRLAALLELGAGFHPELTGRENVEVAGLLLGLSKKEIAARFDAIVRFAELEGFLDAPLRTYSSGMAVRLGFSIAAHSDPDVLLVDEVLAVGDEAFAHRSLEKFAEFEKAGKTIVLVSHDLSLVASRCRRAIWLDGGKIAGDGPAVETVARYRERVAELEGEKRLERETEDGRRETRDVIGSGAARLTGVRVLDASGKPAGRLRSGEPAALEMEVRAGAPLSDFVFGFAISTVSGVLVFGSNTAIDGLAAGAFEPGAAVRVRLDVPALALAQGVYSVDAAIHAADGAPYDYRRDVLRFEVSGAAAPTAGVWSPPRRWSFDGPVSFR